jgi:hypothetical protein
MNKGIERERESLKKKNLCIYLRCFLTFGQAHVDKLQNAFSLMFRLFWSKMILTFYDV